MENDIFFMQAVYCPGQGLMDKFGILGPYKFQIGMK